MVVYPGNKGETARLHQENQIWLVHCVKNLTPHLLGKLFTARTDQRNLLYLSNLSVPTLVRWKVLLLELQFVIQHIPGDENVMADKSHENILPKHKRHLFVDDSIQRIIRLGEEGMEVPGEVQEEGESGGKEYYDAP